MSSMISSFSGAAQSYYESRAIASVQEQNARLALIEAGIAEKDIRREITTLQGKQASLYAKAGVDLSSGSPLLVMAHTKAEGERQISRIKTKGRMEYILGHWAAKMIKKGGSMAAISGAISGIASLAGMVAGGIGGGMSGGATGALSGAMTGGGGGGSYGWSSLLSSLQSRRDYGLGTSRGYR